MGYVAETQTNILQLAWLKLVKHEHLRRLDRDCVLLLRCEFGAGHPVPHLWWGQLLTYRCAGNQKWICGATLVRGVIRAFAVALAAKPCVLHRSTRFLLLRLNPGQLIEVN